MDYYSELNNRLKAGVLQINEAQAMYDYAINLQKKDLPVIFDQAHLSTIVNIQYNSLMKLIEKDNISSMYYQFEIPKRNGTMRTIDAPKIELKAIQEWILHNILEKIVVSCAAKAYIKNKSIVDNAKYHINCNQLYKLDFADFFTNIKFPRIYSIFYTLGYTKQVAFTLSKFCLKDDYLPQGAPTSPALSNIVCRKLDNRLLKYAQTHHLIYTRYADDVAVSTKLNFNIEQINVIKKIISEEGFIINENKTKILKKSDRQILAGIVINNGIHVIKEIKKKLRQEIYYCKKIGVHENLLRKEQYYSFYKEHLFGMAFYIKMVERSVGTKFIDELLKIDWEY